MYFCKWSVACVQGLLRDVHILKQTVAAQKQQKHQNQAKKKNKKNFQTVNRIR